MKERRGHKPDSLHCRKLLEVEKGQGSKPESFESPSKAEH